VKKALYEKKDRIATVTLNRPEALNSLDDELNAELGRSGRTSRTTPRWTWPSSPAPAVPSAPART